MKQRIYLAARYSRWHELTNYAQQLREYGFTVTSRWLEGRSPLSPDGLSEELDLEQRTWFAQQDWEDLMDSDICISFTEPPRSSNTRGGRHVELGAALAAHKRIIVVGHRENVFHCLPQIEFHQTWQECFVTLIPYACDSSSGPIMPVCSRLPKSLPKEQWRGAEQRSTSEIG